MKKLLALCALGIALVACTQNERAKNFGGESTARLAPCQKLIIATWKDDNLWYLTRPFRDGEKPETFTFKEDSSFGMWQGTVTIVESCSSK
jgi:hypothetical protein